MESSPYYRILYKTTDGQTYRYSYYPTEERLRRAYSHIKNTLIVTERAVEVWMERCSLDIVRLDP